MLVGQKKCQNFGTAVNAACQGNLSECHFGRLCHSLPAMLCMHSSGYWVTFLPGGESSWRLALTIHPCLAPRLKEERSYASAPFLCLHDLLFVRLKCNLNNCSRAAHRTTAVCTVVKYSVHCLNHA